MAFYQQEEEQLRLGRRLSKEAIALAIQGRWEEAVASNRSIIERFPGDVGAYNRLGRALAESGEFGQAKEAYRKALELAPRNVIAAKNLARLASLPETRAPLDGGRHRVAPELFITEMSKAGVVDLCNLAPSEVLARMGIGNQVRLRMVRRMPPRRHPISREGQGRRKPAPPPPISGEGRLEAQSLVVENDQGEHLGEVAPKHGLRLMKLIEGGNRYAAGIHSVGEDGVRVIIREEYQHPSQVGCPSFPVKATERLRPHGKQYLLRHDVIAQQDEETREVESVEGEAGYSEDKSGGRGLPEGFSVLGEADERRGLER